MVYIVYTVILPEIYEQKGALVFLFNFFMGTLMAVNTFFHYTMGWLTNPGVVPNVRFFNNLKTQNKNNNNNNNLFDKISPNKRQYLRMWLQFVKNV